MPPFVAAVCDDDQESSITEGPQRGHAMSDFFRLKNAFDLREKLRRDLEKLKAKPLDADAAFNFFITALHMLDWVYPGKTNAKRVAAEKSSVLLRVCADLGNGAKHFELEIRKETSVSATSQLQGGWFGLWLSPWWFGDLFGSERLIVSLAGDASTTLGQIIEVTELAEKLMEYWDKHSLR
jgi:hypothetical protein